MSSFTRPTHNQDFSNEIDDWLRYEWYPMKFALSDDRRDSVYGLRPKVTAYCGAHHVIQLQYCLIIASTARNH